MVERERSLGLAGLQTSDGRHWNGCAKHERQVAEAALGFS
jgi:hypothetical protein